jgi:hypothetical protein
MSLNHFSEIFMPYLISCGEDGEWYVLNREYMPLGIVRRQEGSHAGNDVGFEMKIPQKFLDMLKTVEHRPRAYWFYDDLTNPALSKKNRDRYLKLVGIFLNLKCWHEGNAPHEGYS